MTVTHVEGAPDRLNSRAAQAVAEQLKALRLYRQVHTLCTMAGVDTADVLGSSREPKHLQVRAEAWALCVARGMEVQDVARLWKAELAVVRHVIDSRIAPMAASADLTIPIHVEPTGWLRERDVLAGVEAICTRHGVTLHESFGRSRNKRIVAARHAAWAWLRERGWSYPDIAEPWGVDHTSVMYGVRKVAA